MTQNGPNISPLVSIIVHNFKGTDRLECCLSSLTKSDYPDYEIIVVDGLTRGINEWIKVNFPRVKLVHFDLDEGIPARLNAALSRTDVNSKYIARLDNDMEVHKNWLSSLVDAMEQDFEIGFAQALLLKKEGRKQVDCVGGFLDKVGYSYLSPFVGNANAKLGEIKEVSYAIAGLIRRKALDNVSGIQRPFDSDYFVHWYDIDASWRIQLAGYKIVFVPNSIIYHERRLTSGRSRLQGRNIFLNTRNRIMTLMKNYSLENLAKYMPLLMAFQAIEVVALLRKNPDHAAATIRGVQWVFRHLREVWKKRVLVQENTRSVPDTQILRYFVRINPVQLYRNFQKHYKV